jgi:putative restriction endonuclease
LVREAYDEQCAICGSDRESPAGNPEIEAAHIYPKEEGGSDDVRNGIGLCKLHHWAFDSGWLSLSDEYEVLVKEAPERSGYYEFKQLEGTQIQLPEVDGAEPHRMFLEAHRGLHGFTDD